MRVIGIDTGKSGGIVTLISRIITPSSGIFDMRVMPSTREVIDWLEELTTSSTEDIHAFIEKAHAMPGQGVTSMFTYGQGYGELLGILMALKIPHTLVPPRTWQKEMHQGASGATAKAKSLDAATRLFPGVRLVDPQSTRAKKPHEGIIDALLIAEYGRRSLRV